MPALTLVSALAAALALAAPASAAEAPQAAWWRLSSRAAPTNLPPGQKALINVMAENFGDTGITGASSQITITDVLPLGLRVTEPGAINPHRARVGNRNAAEKEKFWSCNVTEERIVTCSTPLAIPPYEPLIMEIPVEVNEPPGTHTTLQNQVSVKGGEAQGTGAAVAGATLTRALLISDEPVAFGVEEDGYSLVAENADGSTDTQAGSHPFQLTSTVNFNQTIEEVQEPGSEEVVLSPGAPALTKNLSFELPPGLLGNVTAAERCSEVDFSALEGETNHCPAAAAVGVATVTLLEPNRLRYVTIAVPVFNLQPGRGEPARFGFEAKWVPVVLDASVRTDGDYGVSVKVNNATEAAQVLGAQVTFWGEPASEAHDASRGWPCLREGIERNEGEICEAPNPRPSTAFLTLPTSCTGSLSTLMSGAAWTGEPLGAGYTFKDSLGNALASLEGCDQLPFDPTLGVEPVQPPEEGHPEEHTSSASTPTGLTVDVKLPQQGTLQAGSLGESDVRSATVTLPQGMMLNPSAANGLQACSEQQIGYLGKGTSDPFSPGAVEPLHFTSDPAQCPDASKVGTVHISTPLLGEELTGSVFLAAQEANPFGSLVALYIVAENPVLGLRVKLAGEGTLDGQTGQVSTTFTDTPQVPFEELKVSLFGGPRGSVSTPATCGSDTATASFTPWSATPTVDTTSDPATFQITSGPGGGACPSPSSFTPSFQAGSTNLQAAAFTPFVLNIAHPDADQPLSSITMHLPTGVAALLSSVTPCPEAQAQSNQCGPDSLIGHSLASSGLGSEPVTLPGQVFLTGPYKGAPFGLSVVTPAIAGPFNLGDVTVRSQITVDPSTAAVTITSDPFPTFVRGVPAQLKAITVTVDRPNFEFNPTNCNPMAITGTLTGAQGAAANVSSPFQVKDCGALAFAPKLSASVAGNSTKANGAAFSVKVSSAGLGQANIAKVALQLPVALPARLTTLQKACVAAVFDANPAACNPESVIGSATIHTPVLKNPLSGPAYLVSHGGAAFPDVEFLLQGEGVLLVLDGKTDVKKGITYSRFESAPDAPFTTFETSLPAGPHSALTANVPAAKKFSLCGAKLSMPTVITAQNGAIINQSTKIPVTGCGAVKHSKTKKLTRAQKLSKALKACRKKFKHSHSKRASCEKQARKHFGARKAAHRAAKGKRAKHR